MKKILRNKKAQVGEVIEDFPAFVVIALMLIILVVFTVLMYKGETKAQQQKIDEKIIQDQMEIMLNSLMQERVNGITFADLVRKRDPSVTSRLNQEIWKIYEVYNQRGGIRVNVGGDAKVYYTDAVNECKKIDKFGKNVCFYIPGEELILIKVITFYGSI